MTPYLAFRRAVGAVAPLRHVRGASLCTIIGLMLVACSRNTVFSSAEEALKHDDSASFARLAPQEGGLAFVDGSGYSWLHKASKFNAVKCAEYLIQNKEIKIQNALLVK